MKNVWSGIRSTSRFSPFSYFIWNESFCFKFRNSKLVFLWKLASKVRFRITLGQPRVIYGLSILITIITTIMIITVIRLYCITYARVSRLHLNSNSQQSVYLTLLWVIWPVFVSIVWQSLWQRVTFHRANMFYLRENNFILSIPRYDHWPFDFRHIKYFFRVDHVRKCLVAVLGVKHKT